MKRLAALAIIALAWLPAQALTVKFAWDAGERAEKYRLYYRLFNETVYAYDSPARYIEVIAAEACDETRTCRATWAGLPDDAGQLFFVARAGNYVGWSADSNEINTYSAAPVWLTGSPFRIDCEGCE